MPCYFNVVGSHQGPDSAQAVTPRFVDALAEGERSQRSRSWLADPGLSMCGCGPGHLAAIPFRGSAVAQRSTTSRRVSTGRCSNDSRRWRSSLDAAWSRGLTNLAPVVRHGETDVTAAGRELRYLPLVGCRLLSRDGRMADVIGSN